MEYRNLGRSGLLVSAVGLGCNNFGARADLEQTRRVIDSAIDLGITLFDTADIYGNKGGSEDLMGQVLGAKRKNIVLATKFGMEMGEGDYKKGANRHYIMKAFEDSLRRLRTDYVDLYQLHTPDARTPIEETLRALDDLICQGKVRYIGCSNLKSWQVVESIWTAKAHNLNPFVSIQDEYSLVERGAEKELLPAANAYGLGVLPYFPLASGLLTGKHRKGQKLAEGSRLANTERLANKYATEKNLEIVEKLAGFVEQRGKTMLELAFSWLASRPGVASVIAGAMKPEQLEQNVKAAGWKLSADDLAEIDRITGTA